MKIQKAKRKRIQKNPLRGIKSVLGEIRKEFKIPETKTDLEVMEMIDSLHAATQDTMDTALYEYRLSVEEMHEKGYFNTAMSQLDVW